MADREGEEAARAFAAWCSDVDPALLTQAATTPISLAELRAYLAGCHGDPPDAVEWVYRLAGVEHGPAILDDGLADLFSAAHDASHQVAVEYGRRARARAPGVLGDGPQKIEVRDAGGGKGLGVFAREPIPAGTVVTAYAPDAARISNGVTHPSDVDRRPLPDDIDSADLMQSYGVYTVTPDGKVCQVIGFPGKRDDTTEVGQLANDGIAFRGVPGFVQTLHRRTAGGTRPLTDRIIADVCAEYVAAAWPTTNAEIITVGGVLVLRTTRPVAADDELCMMYGANFWVGKFMPRLGVPFKARVQRVLTSQDFAAAAERRGVDSGAVIAALAKIGAAVLVDHAQATAARAARRAARAADPALVRLCRRHYFAQHAATVGDVAATEYPEVGPA